MSQPTQVEAAQGYDSVADVLAGRKTGQPVRLRGWVHRQRTAGKMAFVVLRDGTGTVQCTVKGGVADDASLEAAKSAAVESAVALLEGTAVADERAPGGFEVKVTRFVLHSRSEPFPLRGEQGTEFELDKRHLWLRSTELSAVLRIKHRLYKGIRDFYDAEGFVEVDPSVITTNACEGGSTLFTFDYFGQTAYLSQSAQMYLEGCIFGTPKVFSITPSFRAEKSRTTKHLTEFHHLEAEAAWWDAEDSRRHQERLVTYLAHRIAKECEADLKILGQDPERLLKVQAPFARVDYAEAIAELQRQGFHVTSGDDFGVPHEKALTEGRTSPIFVCDWPARIKAFYMAEKPGTDRVFCSDLLAPDGYGEIIGGSQRSEDIESMKRRLMRQYVREALEWEAEAFGREHPAGHWTFSAMKDSEGQVLSGIEPEFSETRNRHFTELLKWANETDTSNREEYRKLPLERLNYLIHAVIAGFYESRRTPNLEPEIDYSHHLLDALAENADESLSYLFDDLLPRALKPYEWYFDLRRYGSVPHSGFGLGIERLLRWFTGQEHIRDMLPYPRTPSRAYP